MADPRDIGLGCGGFGPVAAECKSCAQGPANLEGRPKLKVCSVAAEKSELVNCQNGKCKSLLIFVLDQPILAP